MGGVWGGVWGDVWWDVWWGVGVFFVFLLFFRKKKLRHDTFAAAELIIYVHFVL